MAPAAHLGRLAAHIVLPVLGLLFNGIPAAPTGADQASVAPSYVFTSDDVGFADGGGPDNAVDRITAMDEYLGDKKPLLRLDLFWDDVQQCATCAPDWSDLDPRVDAAYERGARVLLVLDYSAPWANGNRKPSYFPTGDDAWSDIVDAAVVHFGPKVQAYEVWNEPNITHFGNYGDNSVATRAGRYWELTRIAYQRVKARCPQCTVLAGGSAGGDVVTTGSAMRNDNEARDWLEWAYQHGMGGYFDAVAYHPYPDWTGGHLPSYAITPCTAGTWYRYWSGFGPDDPDCGGLAALRAVMVSHGDAGKKIWATEFGFPTTGSRTPQSVERVRDAIEEGVRMWRSRPYTGPMVIYSFQDAPRSHPTCRADPADGECHFGLRDINGNPKEPLYTDVGTALRGDPCRAVLSPGRSLFRGAALCSADGRYWLWMQADGNLVLYRITAAGRTPLWVMGALRGYRLVNHDGGLVLYDHADQVLWASGTAGSRASTLWMQDDGNLVLYRDEDAKVIWASGTR
ncbi:hypothetical protein [Actinoplanes palleronii]|uniref:Bulb-type lectin domain-containing protein n=1 Tax=Actinoplanes palleronii TaxID=113570 RepID=A0ABQ4BRN8_9ACTN|nr:hypothetical protein [Actinoplanes palleronii]GIE73336.1 hypothetical protein Apa02nite_094440 [Actinoplanes palleronii]